MITLKRPSEIEAMREAGRVVAQAHRLAREMVVPGVLTSQIDAAIEKLFEQSGAKSLFKGYPGRVPFPAVTCISVNEQVVHGIPGPRELAEGDIVKIDTGCKVNGWCGDSAWTYAVGQVDAVKQRLMKIGEENLRLAIQLVGKSRKWSDVARGMQEHVRAAGFSVVEQFVGHGIGQQMHEDPQVPNFCSPQQMHHDFAIEEGLVLAIEPMVNAGKKEVRIMRDHWTVETRDGLPSVHFEHTVAITANGPLILTQLDDDSGWLTGK